ncbi:MAG: ester cyclase [Anaerolineaceae bacterium]|nr:ester cyclase [Anaerolineaceae bacterium]
MSTETNKAVIRRGFEEGINQQNPAVYDEIIAANYVNHNLPIPVPGPEGFRQMLGQFQAGFPDMRVTVEDVLAEGDKVVTRGFFTGTHLGVFNGIPATGKEVKVPYLDIWRLENGTAVENWVQLDLLGMLQQIGAVPAQ